MGKIIEIVSLFKLDTVDLMFFFTGEYLSNRSWQGLDQQLGQTPVVKAVEGQFGIAAGYTENPANKDLE